MKEKFEYKPDYIIPVGETLKELFIHESLTIDKLINLCGCSRKELLDVLNGDRFDVPEKLKEFLHKEYNFSKEMLNNFYLNYLKDKERLEKENPNKILTKITHDDGFVEYIMK